VTKALPRQTEIPADPLLPDEKSEVLDTEIADQGQSELVEADTWVSEKVDAPLTAETSENDPVRSNKGNSPIDEKIDVETPVWDVSEDRDVSW
jgi:hypothetical protein